jgi:hypothetical protein
MATGQHQGAIHEDVGPSIEGHQRLKSGLRGMA